MKQDGFTMAEILITIGLLGVIIAMTLPSLITKYQKKVTVERLKEAYSILSQAITASELDNGDISNWDFSQDTTGNHFFGMYMKPYLKGAVKIKNEIRLWKSLDGSYNSLGSGMYTKPRYMLPNGYHITVYTFQRYALIFIDINGGKGPNRMGRDVFVLSIYPSQQKKIGKITFGAHELCGSGARHATMKREALLNSGCATCKKNFTGWSWPVGV